MSHVGFLWILIYHHHHHDYYFYLLEWSESISRLKFLYFRCFYSFHHITTNMNSHCIQDLCWNKEKLISAPNNSDKKTLQIYWILPCIQNLKKVVLLAQGQVWNFDASRRWYVDKLAHFLHYQWSIYA